VLERLSRRRGYCATAKYKSDGALDFVIQNATIIDAEAGIVKRHRAFATA